MDDRPPGDPVRRKRPSGYEHHQQDKRRRTPPDSPQRSTRQISTHPTGAVRAAKIDLFTTTTRRKDDRKPKTAALNIATAQRLVLADLQHDIAARAEDVLSDRADSMSIESLGRSIKDYCRSISPCGRSDGSCLTVECQAKVCVILNTCKNAQLDTPRTMSATHFT